MAELFSQYTSGTQFTAGALVGSTLGASGMNPLVDRLNSISPSDGQISVQNIIMSEVVVPKQSVASASYIRIGSAATISTNGSVFVTADFTAAFASGTSRQTLGFALSRNGSVLGQDRAINSITDFNVGLEFPISLNWVDVASGTNNYYLLAKDIASSFIGSIGQIQIIAQGLKN